MLAPAGLPTPCAEPKAHGPTGDEHLPTAPHRRMKIAIVHENWEAGAARCARDLERGLGASHEVVYFPRDDRLTPDQILRGVKSSAEEVLGEIAAFGPDVVNCHSFYSHLPYSFLAEVSRRYPTCFTVHDPRPIGTFNLACWDCDHNALCLRCPLVPGRWRKVLDNEYLRARAWKRLQHLRCGRDMRIVSPSRWLRGRLEQHELRRFDIRTIPYGIDLERFRPMPGIRERLGLRPETPMVLHVAASELSGHYSERKGLRYLAEGFRSRVIPRVPDAILAVAGEDAVPNYPWVRPVGKLGPGDLPAWLSAADIFAAPTLADNLPYTIIEAMGCGCPVVATAIGGVPEEVNHGENGLIVPPRDSEALGEAIVALLLDPARRRAYGAASRARAEAIFAMPQFIAEYEALFHEMIEARQAARPR